MAGSPCNADICCKLMYNFSHLNYALAIGCPGQICGLMHMDDRKFSHVSGFTGYMAITKSIVEQNAPGQRILDIPAGNGLLAERLQAAGNEVVCADINRERDDYTYVDMEQALPFGDDDFDTVICLEGLEHTINPAHVIKELCRVCKAGGRVIISVPNVQNCYSRLHFLFTGTLYQFSPEECCHPSGSEDRDRGHVSPLTYFQLRYLFKTFGARLVHIEGDRFKKKALMPIYVLPVALGYVHALWRSLKSDDPELREITKHMFSSGCLFSRSIIMVFERSAASPHNL